jgi:tRNA uridine 5-carbamoylmethylation protein Kti12
LKSKTHIINLCGGPGIGKSTVASGVFHKLKTKKISCELVTEFAKEITWEETHKLLENQIHIFSEQFRRQWRLIDKVDYVITDSPLLLNSVYYDYYLEKLGDDVKFSKSYIEQSRQFFDATFAEFNNIDFNIERRFEEVDGMMVYPDYDPNGRNQNISESLALDKKIRDKLYKYNPGYISVGGNDASIVTGIVSFILNITTKG